MIYPNSSIINKVVDESIQNKWGWFVAFGVAVFCLGILAFGNLVLATSISVFYVGAFKQQLLWEVFARNRLAEWLQRH